MYMVIHLHFYARAHMGMGGFSFENEKNKHELVPACSANKSCVCPTIPFQVPYAGPGHGGYRSACVVPHSDVPQLRSDFLMGAGRCNHSGSAQGALLV